MGQYTLMDGDNDGAYLVGANYPVVDGSTLRLDAPRAWCWAWPMCSARSCAAGVHGLGALAQPPG
jgi:hypothetical protein